MPVHPSANSSSSHAGRADLSHERAPANHGKPKGQLKVNIQDSVTPLTATVSISILVFATTLQCLPGGAKSNMHDRHAMLEEGPISQAAGQSRIDGSRCRCCADDELQQ